MEIGGESFHQFYQNATSLKGHLTTCKTIIG